MTEQTARISAPPTFDVGRLSDPTYTIEAKSNIHGRCLVHFDPDRSIGAVYFFVGQVWACYGPISFSGFVETMKARRIVAPESDDLATWIAACSRARGKTVN